MSNTSVAKFGDILKSTWTGATTLQDWSDLIKILLKDKGLNCEEEGTLAELLCDLEQAQKQLISLERNSETLSYRDFVHSICDTELYTRCIRAPNLTREATKRLIDIWTDHSTEPCSLPPNIGNIITSFTTVAGPAEHAGVVGLQPSNWDPAENELDSIAQSLAPALGVSNTGSTFSSISIQRNEGLVQLKYPENGGYAQVEVNIGRLSKVQSIDVNEAWKHYDFRMKCATTGPADLIYIQAMKLVKMITDRYAERRDGKKSVFKRKATRDDDDRWRPTTSGHKRRREDPTALNGQSHF